VSIRSQPQVAWARWKAREEGVAATVGAEEEVMLLRPDDWGLAQEIDSVMPALSPELASHVTPETHGSALELGTGVHRSVASAADELRKLRRMLAAELEPLGLRAASAGTHPFAVWQDTVISGGSRYQFLYGSMRELARREPTFALHVHVGVDTPERGIRAVDRLRAHLPMLLALSVNSPFWQGRDTGLSSARTPLFQAFPRVGIPRRFRSYEEWVEAVDLLIRCDAFPEPTFLWWDVRPQPRFGTVEVRIMDAQTTVDETAALVALVQSLVRLEVEEGYVSEELLEAPEVLDENRFLAARDGMEARFVDPERGYREPARDELVRLLAACRPHAQDLGCADELEGVAALAAVPGSECQLAMARGADRLPGLVAALAAAFLAQGGGGRVARLGD
jgi:carboxylate-amine ligase